MQGSHLEKLFFAISLIDKVTEPSKQVAKSMADLQSKFHKSTMDIVTGGTSFFVVGASLEKISRETREMNKALGEVESLGVVTGELEKLEAASMKFTNKFGGNSIDIVRSAYDIQSAIPGLADGALAAFTTSSALLGKATKSTSDVMTGYMGTMYNIFEEDAKKIGQANWVQAMTGKTAEAVKIFKTTGTKMSSAFSSLGSTGKISGVGIDEQMAVLGTLQGSMDGAVAGTAYKGFLSKLEQGQKSLNLSFKGADGELLPVYEIMERIKKSVSHLDKDQQVAKLTKAFGETGASAVMNLMKKTHQLKGNIESLSKINDASGAEKMAESMRDELEVFAGAWNNIKIAIGKGILPILNSMLAIFVPIIAFASELISTSATCQVIVGTIASLISLISILFGIIKLYTGFVGMLKTFVATLELIKSATIMQTIATKVSAAAQWLWNTALAGAQVATMLFSAALWACPLTWVVAGIVAVIAAVVLSIMYWDKIVDALVCAWEWFNNLIDDLGIFGDILLIMLGPIGAIIYAFREWETIKEIVGNILNWVLEKWNSTIGLIGDAWNYLFGDDNKEIEITKNIKQSSDNAVIPEIVKHRKNNSGDVVAGGVTSSQTTNNNNTNFGGVNIYNNGAMSPGQLEEWALLQG